MKNLFMKKINEYYKNKLYLPKKKKSLNVTKKLNLAIGTNKSYKVSSVKTVDNGQRAMHENTRNSTYDFSSEVIKIFWKTQQFFRDSYVKALHWNRWKFKKKFWKWYNSIKKNDNRTMLKKNHTFPSCEVFLRKMGLALTKQGGRILYDYGFIKINNTKSNPKYSLCLGDTFSLSPNVVSMLNQRHIQKFKFLKKNKYSKKIYRLIKTSQWRDRKMQRSPYFSYLLYNKFRGFPKWIQFDTFVASGSVIHSTGSGIYKLNETKNIFLLQKLTPWRLNI